ncbi:hypothetical protein XH83_25425 [Bradyrhizobium sp. CCBAU 53351]|nr:hypothetical protein XH83_25425 [Bradyrhizobium sp. CCBAU 53351]
MQQVQRDHRAVAYAVPVYTKCDQAAAPSAKSLQPARNTKLKFAEIIAGEICEPRNELYAKARLGICPLMKIECLHDKIQTMH